LFPCPCCKPIPIENGKKKRRTDITKAELMRRGMAELAARRHMHIEFVGENAMVTTIAGEWYFNYNIRPIQLHHKNNEQRYDKQGRLTGFYHQQKISFQTPMAALAYIYQHERSLEDRAFSDCPAQGPASDSKSTTEENDGEP